MKFLHNSVRGFVRRVWIKRILTRRANHTVAFARGPLDAMPIDHSDLAATVSDVAKLLESRGGRVDRRTPNAQHLSQEILCQRELVEPELVLCHENPARIALLN